MYMGMTPMAYRNSHRTMSGQPMLEQPDIMKLNWYQNFDELGYDTEDLK